MSLENRASTGVMSGLLVKGVGGLYTVYSNGEYFAAKARGKFRKNMQKPVIGDHVDFIPAVDDEDFGVIERIYERKNSFVRPAVANIDLLLAVMASKQPEPDLMLIDRLLLFARIAQVEAYVVINKADIGDTAFIAEQYERSGYTVFCVSAQTGEGIDELRRCMSGRISAYAGQSAVGKSSILNAISGDFNIATGDLSRIERGKHTTRHVELLPLGENSWVCDTPGFSLLETDAFEPEELKNYYTEYTPYSDDCRFMGCNHINEPDCAVKNAAAEGVLSKERLERYGAIFAEIKEKWSRRYD